MDFERAKNLRDRRLRRSLLFTLHASRHSATGGINGQTLADVVESACADGQGFEDGDHLIRLVRDLENKQMAAVQVGGLRRGQRLRPDHLHVKVLDKGSRLMNETEPPDPDIDDERIEVKS